MHVYGALFMPTLFVVAASIHLCWRFLSDTVLSPIHPINVCNNANVLTMHIQNLTLFGSTIAEINKSLKMKAAIWLFL